MSIHQKIRTVTVFDAKSDLKLARAFLQAHGPALARAAHRLGGGAASGRVFTLRESLANSQRLTRMHCRRLASLHRLLTLQQVGAPERIELGLFADLDPGSRVVDEICLLSEKLEHLLYQISADDPVDTAKVFPDTA